MPPAGKPASDDRKLAHELKTALKDEMEGGLRPGGVNTHGNHLLHPQASPGLHVGSSGSPGSSPLGNLNDSSTRKLLVNLIGTMNAVFQDYDFSSIRPESFSREQLRMVVMTVNHRLAELADVLGPQFLEELWQAMDEVVTLDKCEVFSYVPDMDGDPFSDGNLWSFNYFFVNRRDKRILFFACVAKSKLQSMEEDGLLIDEMEEISPTRQRSFEDIRDEENFVVDL